MFGRNPQVDRTVKNTGPSGAIWAVSFVLPGVRIGALCPNPATGHTPQRPMYTGKSGQARTGYRHVFSAYH